MPSNAYSTHLMELLVDADELLLAHRQALAYPRGPVARLMALNRAVVVASVSAWESYVEELVREAVEALRPPAGVPLGAWPALAAFATGQVTGFHTPSASNIERLVRACLGLANVPQFWAWPNCTAAQAAQRLGDILAVRHEIAHGVNPRPTVRNAYADPMPAFFGRLARRTDDAVRSHLVGLGAGNPWSA